MMLDESESERFTNDALDVLVKREELMLLKEALDRLEPKYAVPIRLRCYSMMRAYKYLWGHSKFKIMYTNYIYGTGV